MAGLGRKGFKDAGFILTLFVLAKGSREAPKASQFFPRSLHHGTFAKAMVISEA